MKVSIITAVYNRVETVMEAVESVRSQQGVDVEHIIIDGGSTDGTLGLLEKSLNDGCSLVSEPDNGIYDALNKGIQHATGDIIGVMHSDDFYANEWVLKEVIEVFSANNTDVVYGDALFVNSKDITRLVRRYSSGYFSVDRIAMGWMPAHTALFVRKSVFEKFGLYKIDYRIAADFEWVARVFKIGKINFNYVPKILVHMRTGGVSTAGWRNTILLNIEVLKACRENDIDTNIFKILFKYPIKILEFFRLRKRL